MSHSKSNTYDPIKLLGSILGEKNKRTYNVEMAKRLGGVDYAVILSDLIDSYLYFYQNNKLISHIEHGDGFMYYTIAGAYERCGVNRWAFEKSIKMFTDLGFLSTIVKFGNLGRKHFKLDVSRICDWFFASENLEMQKPTTGDVGTYNSSCRNLHQTNLKNESNKTSKKRPFSSDTQEKKSASSKSSFNPKTYVLRNGEKLSHIMQCTLMKQMKDPEQRRRILSNVAWYENEIDRGIIPQKGHERMLQWALSENISGKENCKDANLKYAKIMKEEYKLQGLDIKKTVVILNKFNCAKPESIPLNLNELTFRNIIDSYVDQFDGKWKTA